MRQEYIPPTNQTQACPSKLSCNICTADAFFLGSQNGNFRQQDFRVFRCSNCYYTFLANPWLDYKDIYNEVYYKGKGADPLVDYVFELEKPDQTIRQYEWRGIVKAVRSLVAVNRSTRWLDFGCGNGGLVTYCRKATDCSIWGYEEGWIIQEAAKRDVPLLRSVELDSMKGSFDIVTAIEVLEHLPNPLEQLRQIRSLLKPGGLFFFTTGNAEPFRDKFFQWPYFIPEIHVGFFEPKTVACAFQKTGFRADFRGFMPGFQDIIRFKVLKRLGLRRTTFWEQSLPWKLASKVVDRRFKVTAHPLGWAE